MQSPDAEIVTSKKVRSQTVGNDSFKKKKCGLIVLHRNDQIQKKIAIRQCHALGYKPLVLDHPVNLNEQPKTTITRIKHLLNLFSNVEISFVLVEANYSNPGQKTPNIELLKYFLGFLESKLIFATSSTEACLENIKANPELNDIMLSDPAYNIIKSHVTNLNRKLSLPLESTESLSEERTSHLKI